MLAALAPRIWLATFHHTVCGYRTSAGGVGTPLFCENSNGAHQGIAFTPQRDRAAPLFSHHAAGTAVVQSSTGQVGLRVPGYALNSAAFASTNAWYALADTNEFIPSPRWLIRVDPQTGQPAARLLADSGGVLDVGLVLDPDRPFLYMYGRGAQNRAVLRIYRTPDLALVATVRGGSAGISECPGCFALIVDRDRGVLYVVESSPALTSMAPLRTARFSLLR